MAREICRLGEKPADEFSRSLNLAIWQFPGNANQKKKTVDNWRTEISALFGLLSKAEGKISASKLASGLAENLDLISFFRTYLAKFQYPGGHTKPSYTAECIKENVRFKPAAFVIRVLLAGQAKADEGKFWIDKKEATALIWNDLRVTRGDLRPDEVAHSIITHRLGRTEFDGDGDVTRYAGDVLDYMVLANILSFHPNGRYSLIPGLQGAASMILSNETFFLPYEPLYELKGLDASTVSLFDELWFDYAGNQIENLVIETDPLSVLESYADDSMNSASELVPLFSGDSVGSKPVEQELLDFLRDKLSQGSKIATKETGDAGEFIVLKHEFNRLSLIGAHEQAKKVKKIPDHLGVGFDIKSFLDATETQKLIEVKTSISHGKLKVSQFRLTKNEWKAAEASGNNYYVYRILISNRAVSCFVIHDPVAKYKSDKVIMTIGEGAEIKYRAESGLWEELLLS